MIFVAIFKIVLRYSLTISIMSKIFLFIVTCDATRFCCKNGISGCEGRCLSLGVVDDGKRDCDDGSDEEVTLAEGI